MSELKPNLVEGRTYTATVMAIRQMVDSFHKATGGTSYCHQADLKVLGFEGDLFTVQICTDTRDLDLFEANDDIKFSAHKFSKGQWTIKFVERKARKQVIQTSTPDPQPGFESVNPMVAGTAIERAYAHAAVFLQMRNATNDEFQTVARLIYADIISKVK